MQEIDWLQGNQLAGVVGGSGGLFIIPAVIQVFLNNFILGMEPLGSVQHPRIYQKVLLWMTKEKLQCWSPCLLPSILFLTWDMTKWLHYFHIHVCTYHSHWSFAMWILGDRYSRSAHIDQFYLWIFMMWIILILVGLFLYWWVRIFPISVISGICPVLDLPLTCFNDNLRKNKYQQI